MRRTTELSSPLQQLIAQTFSLEEYEPLIPSTLLDQTTAEPSEGDDPKYQDQYNQGLEQDEAREPKLLNVEFIADVVYSDGNQNSEKVLNVIGEIDGIGVPEEKGASPVNNQTKDAAKEVVLGLFYQYGLYISEACSMENGGIELEAESRYWDLGIWVEPTGVVSYVISGLALERTSEQGTPQEVISKIWETISS